MWTSCSGLSDALCRCKVELWEGGGGEPHPHQSITLLVLHRDYMCTAQRRLGRQAGS